MKGQHGQTGGRYQGTQGCCHIPSAVSTADCDNAALVAHIPSVQHLVAACFQRRGRVGEAVELLGLEEDLEQKLSVDCSPIELNQKARLLTRKVCFYNIIYRGCRRDLYQSARFDPLLHRRGAQTQRPGSHGSLLDRPREQSSGSRSMVRSRSAPAGHVVWLRGRAFSGVAVASGRCQVLVRAHAVVADARLQSLCATNHPVPYCRSQLKVHWHL